MNNWKLYSVVLIVLALAGVAALAFGLTQSEVCTLGPTGNICPPGASGAHGGQGTTGHSAVTGGCSVCHQIGGLLAFVNGGPAYNPIYGYPAFDATAKTCSNVACHAVAAGTFSYYFPDGTGEPALNTVSYGGAPPRITPSWYATGAVQCTACHYDPPGGYAWHSGYHGGQGPTGAHNQCQFCHPDASSPNNGIGDTITNPSLHANGTANVQATFTSACFSCH